MGEKVSARLQAYIYRCSYDDRDTSIAAGILSHS